MTQKIKVVRVILDGMISLRVGAFVVVCVCACVGEEIYSTLDTMDSCWGRVENGNNKGRADKR